MAQACPGLRGLFAQRPRSANSVVGGRQSMFRAKGLETALAILEQIGVHDPPVGGARLGPRLYDRVPDLGHHARE